MARIRSIKPELFISETVTGLGDDLTDRLAIRWTFTGLLTYADDSGCGRDEPRLVKAAVWALDDDVDWKHVATHLDRLEGAGLICRYQVDGKHYLHITGWEEHQKISHPATSRIPPCPKGEHRPSPGATSGTSPEERRSHAGDAPEERGTVRPPRARARSMEHGTGSMEQGSNTIVDPPTSARPASAHDPPLPVGEIFRSWLGSFGEDPTSTRFQLSPPRLDAITAALARYPFEDVRDAVRGWVNDPWPERAQQNDITQLLHMGSKRKPANVLEKMRDLWRRGPPAELGKRTRETVNNATQLRAVGIAKGVIGNGAGHELGTVGAARQPDQRELARPADRSADSG